MEGTNEIFTKSIKSRIFLKILVLLWIKLSHQLKLLYYTDWLLYFHHFAMSLSCRLFYCNHKLVWRKHHIYIYIQYSMHNLQPYKTSHPNIIKNKNMPKKHRINWSFSNILFFSSPPPYCLNYQISCLLYLMWFSPCCSKYSHRSLMCLSQTSFPFCLVVLATNMRNLMLILCLNLS